MIKIKKTNISISKDLQLHGIKNKQNFNKSQIN
jgi:hypothetical protein